MSLEPDEGEEPVTDPRVAGRILLRRYLPCRIGSPAFTEIAGDYGGKGTTCGYLGPWLWWRLGDVEGSLLDRSVPEAGLVYTAGEQIKRALDGAKAEGAYYAFRGPSGPQPEPCDWLYFFRTSPSGGFLGGEHVCLFQGVEDDGSWTTADAGRGHGPLDQHAEIVTRPSALGGRGLLFEDGPRTLIGFVSLTGLRLKAPPFDVCYRPGSAGAE